MFLMSYEMAKLDYIEVLHLLVGVILIGLGESLAKRIKARLHGEATLPTPKLQTA